MKDGNTSDTSNMPDAKKSNKDGKCWVKKKTEAW